MSRIRLAWALAFGLCLVAAAMGGAALGRVENPSEPGPRASASDIQTVSVPASLSKGGHRLGPADAVVTFVEFGDFQCPYCAALSRAISAAQLQYPGKVAIIFRQFPLVDLHPAALAAARAADCASRQIPFRAIHDVLYAKQDSLGLEPWAGLARQARVRDTGRFTACMKQQGLDSSLAGDIAAGESVRVVGTPTLFVAGERIDGNPGLSVLDSIIRAQLTGRRE